MSAAIARILRCDHKSGCERILTTGKHLPAAELRVAASRSGWQTVWSRESGQRIRIDLCDQHRGQVPELLTAGGRGEVRDA